MDRPMENLMPWYSFMSCFICLVMMDFLSANKTEASLYVDASIS